MAPTNTAQTAANVRKKKGYMGAKARCFPFLSGYLKRGFCAGLRNSTELNRERSWRRRNERERWANPGRITESVSCFPHRLCRLAARAGTSMLPGDKVLFFTKPPSVAQARPIRWQWLVNSSQSGGEPRRDRDHSAILLMNYLSGRNNNVPVSRPLLFWFRGRIFHAMIRILFSRRVKISRTVGDCKTTCN